MRLILLALVLWSCTAFTQEQQHIETVIQKGHLQQVTCSAFHPSGNYVVTGSGDYSIKLWNKKTGKEIRSFNAHTGEIRSVDFSEDGSQLLSVSKDNTFKVFDVLTGKVLLSDSYGKEDLWDGKFAPNNKIIISDGRDNVYLYDLELQVVVGEYTKSYSRSAKKNHINPNGLQIAEFVNYKEVKLIPLAEPYDTISISFDKANTAEFSPNGKYFALGSAKLFSTIYDAKTGKELHTLIDDPNVKCDGCNMEIAFSNNGKLIATGTKNTNLVIWHTSSGKKSKTLLPLTERPRVIEFSPDDKYLLVSDNKRVLVFEVKTGNKKLEITSDLISYYHPSFSPDGKSIIIPDTYNTASLWDIPTRKKQKTYKGYLNVPRTDQLKYSYSKWTDKRILNLIKNKTEVAFSSDGKYFIQGKIDTIAQLVNIQTGKIHHRLYGHSKQVMSFAFSPDNKLVATGGGDANIILWNVATGKRIRTFIGHRNLIFDLKFNLTGNQLISSSWDGSIRTWEVATGKETGYKGMDNASSYEIGFHPNDLYFISADLAKNLTFIEADAKEVFRSHIGHTKTVSGFDFSNDGTTLVSSSWDGTVKVWNGETGMLKSKFTGHSGAVLSVVHHPQKDLAFSGGADRTIKIFETNSGKEVKTLVGHSSSVSSLSIASQAGILISCSVDGVVKIWDLDTYQELYTYITIDNQNWLAKNRSGYFDGTGKALKLINYVSGMESLSVGSFFKKYHAPGLQKRIMNGEKFKETGQNIHELIKSASEVATTFKDFQNKKTTPISDSIYQHHSDNISLNISASSNTDIAEQVRIYNNGKLILNESFKEEVNFRGANKQERTFNIGLVPGLNKLEIISINKNGIESAPQKFKLFYDKEAGKTDLFLFTIGVNDYKNKSYTLNYARNDAESFAKAIKKGATSIFNEINSYALHDSEVTKANIDATFKEIASKIGPEDVFVLYYAGHGVMSIGSIEDGEEKSGDFYLVTHDVTNLFGDTQMLIDRAVSAKELMDYSRLISAQKQLFVIDACQSGGALTAFASRGAPREKALAQLARSTGTFFLTASQDAQYANEVGDLKHGIFTYSILEVLTGKHSAYASDHKITVNEIKSYVENRVPELSKQYHGTEQYPTSYSFGQDFPLTVVK
ncbi:MAG: caspase family protein [Flavobacteriales bacterium]|nr:caspase family protein [Flavobacteriales bacterium]